MMNYDEIILTIALSACCCSSTGVLFMVLTIPTQQMFIWFLIFRNEMAKNPMKILFFLTRPS